MIKFENILVPSDFSIGFDVSLKAAKEFAKSFDSTIHIVHVIQNLIYPIGIEMGPGNLSDLENEMVNSANQNLKTISEKLKVENINHSISICHGNPANEIVDYAVNNKVDLIIIATHGTSGFEHLLFGSTTEKVLRKASCPVMVMQFPKDKN